MSKAAVDGKFRAEGRCRLCLRSAKTRPLTRHRIVPGSAGGRYEPDNCVPLCRVCHDLVDNRRDREEKRLARKMLRASLWPVEVSHAMRGGSTARWVHGDSWRLRRLVVNESGWDFDAAYPKPARQLIEERRRRAKAA